MKRVGIMGGTFDPIHLGHLAAAEAARYGFSLEKVIFVPAGNPPHKSGKITPSSLRLEMVKVATADRPYFEVSDYEVCKQGKSYTIETIDYFRTLFDKKRDIYFITGSDAIFEILTWRDIIRLMEICKFIAVARPGYQGLKEIANLPEFVQKRVYGLEVPGLSISSTEIRNNIRSGKGIGDLVPAGVESYIHANRLYHDN